MGTGSKRSGESGSLGIKKVKRETLNDKVEQSLRKMLQEEHWKDGERLPPEAELAELFGVSRLTVRLALQRLSAQGLIAVRAGDGAFARKFSLRTYLDAASDLYVTPEMLDDVCEFRKLLEVECARLACERATELDFAAMQRACDVYLAIIHSEPEWNEETVERRIQADLDFHYSLCKASHNSMYILAFNAARGAIVQHLNTIIPQRLIAHPEANYTSNGKEIHQYILDTLRKRDFEHCRLVYTAHIDHHLDLVQYLQGVRLLGAQET